MTAIREQYRSDQSMIEPFVEYRGHSRPTLRTWTHPRTMSVAWYWNPGLQFASALNSDTMNAELLAIWRHCKPQCRYPASFERGQLGGFLRRVPHEAGHQAVAVIRRRSWLRMPVRPWSACSARAARPGCAGSGRCCCRLPPMPTRSSKNDRSNGEVERRTDRRFPGGNFQMAQHKPLDSQDRAALARLDNGFSVTANLLRSLAR
jgi:hypothetical protein